MCVYVVACLGAIAARCFRLAGDYCFKDRGGIISSTGVWDFRTPKQYRGQMCCRIARFSSVQIIRTSTSINFTFVPLAEFLKRQIPNWCLKRWEFSNLRPNQILQFSTTLVRFGDSPSLLQLITLAFANVSWKSIVSDPNPFVNRFASSRSSNEDKINNTAITCLLRAIKTIAMKVLVLNPETAGNKRARARHVIDFEQRARVSPLDLMKGLINSVWSTIDDRAVYSDGSYASKSRG